MPRLVERAPWFPPRGLEAQLKVLNDLDPRIVGSGRFQFDLDLARSLAKTVMANSGNSKDYDKDFMELYFKIIDSYNRYVSAFNRGEPPETSNPSEDHVPF